MRGLCNLSPYLSLNLSLFSSLCSINRHHIIVFYMSALSMLKAQILHCQSQMHLGANGLFKRRILLANQLQHLRAVHCFYLLAFVRFAETCLNNLCNVLFVGIVLVQLLNTCHLLVGKPVRCLQLVHLIHQLSI